MKNNLESLFNFTLDELRDYIVSIGGKKFNADQVFRWLYKNNRYDFENWTNVPNLLKDHIREKMTLSLHEIKWQGVSSDGTIKFLMGLEDGESIETVLIKAKDRQTLCVSSQVGCAMKCSFCHTGTQGFKRNLKASEVVLQYMTVRYWLKENGYDDSITNIVYMGQGEPLHNFEEIKRATMIFMEPSGIFLGQRKITLSTSGLVPMIRKLKDFPPVNIAISLHSPRNEVRNMLMPINKVHNLEELLKAINEIPLRPHRSITYEYLMIEGVTNTREDMDRLSRLLPRETSKINLIPFNEYPGSVYKRPTDESIENFCSEMINRGLVTTIRHSKGRDILAACGQLKTQKEKINSW